MCINLAFDRFFTTIQHAVKIAKESISTSET